MIDRDTNMRERKNTHTHAEPYKGNQVTYSQKELYESGIFTGFKANARQTLQDFSEILKNDIYHLFRQVSFPYLCRRKFVLRQRLHVCLRCKGRLLRSKTAMRFETSK